MKLFYTENGKKVVYVQRQDIMYLFNETNIPIPASIFREVFKEKLTLVNDQNRFEFIKFNDESDVKFFSELDFIIDFDKYKNLTKKEFYKTVQKLTNEGNRIVRKWNRMSEVKRRKNDSLYYEYCNINYKIKFLGEIYEIKYGEKNMPFPDFVKM